MKEEHREGRERRKIERRSSGTGIMNPNHAAKLGETAGAFSKGVAATSGTSPAGISLKMRGKIVSAGRRATVNLNKKSPSGSAKLGKSPTSGDVRTPPSRRSTVMAEGGGAGRGGGRGSELFSSGKGKIVSPITKR